MTIIKTSQNKGPSSAKVSIFTQKTANSLGSDTIFIRISLSAGNPIKYTDPDGEFATLLGAIIGGLTSAAVSISSDLRKTGKVDLGNTLTAALGGAVAGAMLGSVIDTFGATAIPLGTLIVAGSMSSVVGGAVTDVARGENPLDLGSVATDAIYGAGNIIIGQSIGKMGEVTKAAINKPHVAYMQNTNSKGAAPLEVNFRETIKAMNTNDRIVGGATKFAEQIADIAKDVYRDINDNKNN
jgi:hypothetical protein